MKALIGAAIALRLLASVGISPTVYVDSAEYQGVALFGGERRPWTVPLLHAAVGDSTARVVVHAALGALAWATLALAVAAVVRHPAVRWVAAATVLAMGLAPTVTNYDATITSETVAVSLTVLLFAAWIRLVTEPGMRAATDVLVVTVLFAFTRNDHPWLLVLLAVLVVVLAVRWRERAWAVVAVGLVVVSAWSVAAAGRNDDIERFNLAMVMANRIVPDVEQLEWFTDRDMPVPRGVEPGVGLVDGDTTLAFADDEDWNEWASDHGRLTYAQFLLTHPDHLLLEPWPEVVGLQSTTLEAERPSVALLSPGDAYGRSHRVLPTAIESIVWAPGDAAAVLIGLAGLVAVAVASGAVRELRSPRRAVDRLGPVRTLGMAALALGTVHVLLVWHASPIELGRLAMVPATTIHVAVLLLVAVTVDRRVLAPDLRALARNPGAKADG